MKTSNDVVIKYIKTKNKIRRIATYKSDDCALRGYHQKVNTFLSKSFYPSIFTKAYTRGISIFNNAVAHMYNDHFIMLDISDFFHSISHNILIERLYFEINIHDKNNITQPECREIVDMCSTEARGIPLGFITSPILSNIYLKEFDNILYGKLKRFETPNIIYTRYADDICISFKDCIDAKRIEAEIIKLVTVLLRRYKLELNHKKTHLYNLLSSNHVKITGVNVTRDVNNFRRLTVGKRIKNKLFWDAVNYYKCKNDPSEAQRIKGMQSFILSIEKTGYEGGYSDKMMKIISELGFHSLKELIDAL